jgi:hypothetical protein
MDRLAAIHGLPAPAQMPAEQPLEQHGRATDVADGQVDVLDPSRAHSVKPLR